MAKQEEPRIEWALRCPRHGMRADVGLRVDPELAVDRCNLLPGGSPVTCDQRCLEALGLDVPDRTPPLPH